MTLYVCPVVGIVVCFCLGILCQDSFSWSAPVLVLLCALLFSGSAILLNRPRLSSALVHGFFALLGAMYLYSFQKLPSNHISYFWREHQSEVFEIQGKVVSEPRRKQTLKGERTSFELALGKIQLPEFSARTQGKVLVQCYRPVAFSYGDVIRFKGKLHRPYSYSSSKFSYPRYLGRRGIGLVTNIRKTARIDRISPDAKSPLGLLEAWRGQCQDFFKSYLMPQQAALMDAIILGQRTDLSRDMQRIFARTGTTHILAISGFNVGLVAALIFLLLRLFPVPWRLQYALTMVLLFAYAVFTGSSPSVIRAAIMTCVFLNSFLLERESHSMNSLAWAGLVILLFNPNDLFDIGFQLSFLSVIGILVFYPALSQALKQRPAFKVKGFRDFILKLFLVSLSAWTGSLGFVAYYFDLVTPGALLANLIVIPVVSGIVFLGFGLLMTGWIPFMAVNFAVCLKVLLNVMIHSMALISSVPGVCFQVEVQGMRAVILYYAAVQFVYCLLKFRIKEGSQI